MPKKILIIDDDLLVIKSLTNLLTRKGYRVIDAKSGNEAQTITNQQKIDLIICDMRMPGINGVETIKKINDGRKEKVPFIFLTGYADQKLEEESENLKPLDYIYKPFDIEYLLNVIKNHNQLEE